MTDFQNILLPVRITETTTAESQVVPDIHKIDLIHGRGTLCIRDPNRHRAAIEILPRFAFPKQVSDKS